MIQRSSSQTILRDRVDAGRRLVEPLLKYAHRLDVIVLALPRGGVPVAYEVATALAVRLDLMQRAARRVVVGACLITTRWPRHGKVLPGALATTKKPPAGFPARGFVSHEGRFSSI